MINVALREESGKIKSIGENLNILNVIKIFKMKSSLYDIVELDGKGVGCIASQDIEKGTVILHEKPQFAVKGNIKFF